MDGIPQLIWPTEIYRPLRAPRTSADSLGAGMAGKLNFANNHIAIGKLLVFGIVFSIGLDVAAAERFQKLTAAQIRAKLAGMEITDQTHWADVFSADGTLTSYSMGRKSTGKWRVQKDELCVDRGKDDGGCYQVWISGKKVELRREGSKLPLEGVLQKPTGRK